MTIELTADDLGLVEHPIFQEKEVVEFICQDIEENESYQSINVRAIVQSDHHKGRRISIRLSKKREHEMQRIKMARFALAFWTKDEILSGSVPLARVIGRRFTAVAQAPREYQGKTYQDFDFWVDLGPVKEPTPTTTTVVADGEIPF